MGRAAEIARKISWYWGTFVGDLMGDTHYQRYVDLRRRTHPDEPVLSERAYWRMRHDATEANPNPRCC
ncbi:MAG TPA: YbdD/YjiX family protein [Mycobacterium sp.]|nr:YbdD/YjiX family protein [Mycobacterium sp.]